MTLYALLLPNEDMKRLQDENKTTHLLMMNEEIKTYPFGDVWDYFCEQQNVPVRGDWFKSVEQYEQEVLLKRV